MKLAEAFSQLAYGELSQVVLGEHTEGEVNESHYPALLAHLNLGLTALYTRFNLKEGRVTVPLVPGTLSYPITAPDLLKIERVYTDAGCELGLNDLADSYALSTPSTTMLNVPAEIVAQGNDLPDWLKTTELAVAYRANHPYLAANGGFINPLSTEIELPYSHLQALLYFVASRVHNPIGMANEFHAGNSWYAKYEMECQRLEMQNLQIDQGAGNDRLTRNGWV